ncbi:hypothetical protein A9Q86_01275 [Flavobacteriales bacterium 33_180_T64]|nr:hypothetical protein A9Q86_01275 [Flavobacteriales bacterium 33_180_T64]
MKTYSILLRGINVGGHKKVPMADLRELLSKVGFNDVRTYIQSGNIVLQSSESSIQNIEKRIQIAILDRFGFGVPVIAKTQNELLNIFDACPFSEEKKANSYFILLDQIPDSKLVESVLGLSYENEEFQIIHSCIYFYSSTGYGRTKFNMNTFEKKLNVKATSRNYRTIVKLIAMSNEGNKDH